MVPRLPFRPPWGAHHRLPRTIPVVGLARKLEHRLEQLVDGLSAAIFRGGIHPVDLAGRVVRQADLVVFDGELGLEIPNDFTLRLHPDDLAASIDIDALEAELTNALAQTAAERGWRTGGPPTVTVVTDDRLTPGAPQCESGSQPGHISPWGYLIALRGAEFHELGDNRLLVGRGPDCDVVINDPETSRRHARIVRRAGEIWVADAGSANGTTANGSRVGRQPHRVNAGDHLVFGRAAYSLRMS